MTIVRFLRMSAHLQMLPVLESGEETLVGGQAVGVEIDCIASVD